MEEAEPAGDEAEGDGVARRSAPPVRLRRQWQGAQPEQGQRRGTATRDIATGCNGY